MQTDNLILAGAQRALERSMAHSSAVSRAHAFLAADFVNAMRAGPHLALQTPAYSTLRMSVAEIVEDSFAYPDGDIMLRELLAMVSLLADGRADAELSERAAAWRDRAADRYASAHADEIAD